MPKNKKPSYGKFVVKEPGKTDSLKSRPKADSVTRIKALESKYRSAPIPLLPGKSKAVARVVTGKKAGKAADASRPRPTKKAFYLGGEPIAYQG
jgi:hypothetical protein